MTSNCGATFLSVTDTEKGPDCRAKRHVLADTWDSRTKNGSSKFTRMPHRPVAKYVDRLHRAVVTYPELKSEHVGLVHRNRRFFALSLQISRNCVLFTIVSNSGLGEGDETAGKFPPTLKRKSLSTPFRYMKLRIGTLQLA